MIHLEFCRLKHLVLVSVKQSTVCPLASNTLHSITEKRSFHFLPSAKWQQLRMKSWAFDSTSPAEWTNLSIILLVEQTFLEVFQKEGSKVDVALVDETAQKHRTVHVRHLQFGLRYSRRLQREKTWVSGCAWLNKWVESIITANGKWVCVLVSVCLRVWMLCVCVCIYSYVFAWKTTPLCH